MFELLLALLLSLPSASTVAAAF
ncbi:hypothetical protein HaLaN_27195 [Haematococcus lacustris]|uniref:Uncharacterized protein n=1 Tax=Haematococcus lacustris TaxID=44745 RepID=A0A6A0A927_HAELA|nr:hypothetical protein HaLaN_27195 [Haematococcus lacustris]